MTWEAMEDAGIPSSWAGKSVGVFIGISSRLFPTPDETSGGAIIYLATGNAHSVAAGRLSYTAGSLTDFVVDTACSSSGGDPSSLSKPASSWSKAAIVGAVNCLFSPELSIASRLGFHLPDVARHSMPMPTDLCVQGMWRGRA